MAKEYERENTRHQSLEFLFLDNQVPKPNPHVQVYQRPAVGNHNLRPTPG